MPDNLDPRIAVMPDGRCVYSGSCHRGGTKDNPLPAYNCFKIFGSHVDSPGDLRKHRFYDKFDPIGSYQERHGVFRCDTLEEHVTATVPGSYALYYTTDVKCIDIASMILTGKLDPATTLYWNDSHKSFHHHKTGYKLVFRKVRLSKQRNTILWSSQNKDTKYAIIPIKAGKPNVLDVYMFDFHRDFNLPGGDSYKKLLNGVGVSELFELDGMVDVCRQLVLSFNPSNSVSMPVVFDLPRIVTIDQNQYQGYLHCSLQKWTGNIAKEPYCRRRTQ